MKDYPKITLVTPVKNGAKYIEDTIVSIISQQYPNLEYIIIDGGSSDGTLDIIKKYEKHITYWISEPDKGLYDAINKGFAKSSGEIMGWLGASDCLLPKSLFTVADIFNNFPNIEWITGIITLIEENGKIVYSGFLPSFNRIKFLSNEYSTISQESTFWKRTLWIKAGRCNPNFKYGGDYELWIRFFRFAKLYSVQTILGAYRVSSDSITNLKKEEWLEDHRKAIETELNLYPHLKKQIEKIRKRNKYDNFFNYLPIIRSIWWRVFRDLFFTPTDKNLSPVIVWDTNLQK